jgi:stage II sporulation protein D
VLERSPLQPMTLILKPFPALLLLAACATAPGSRPEPAAAPNAPAEASTAPARAGPIDLPAPPEPTSRRVDFKNANPVIPVRLMENASSVTFSAKGRLKLKLAGKIEKTIDTAPGALWTVKVRQSTAAVVVAAIQLAEFPFIDKAGLAAAQTEMEAQGLKVTSRVLGGVFGIAGKVIDNRRYLLMIDEPARPLEQAQTRQAELLQQTGIRTTLLEELQVPPTAILEVLDADGASVGLAEDRIVADPVEGATIDVRKVEYGVGYDNHSFEDRSYRGSLQLSADRNGKIAATNLIGLEDLLKGLVPSEIFSRAHLEALKAQAVTARGEVLAKIGLKHHADPYLLCTEQHCAVYRGVSGEAATTNAAVEATRGEALFDESGKLVDSVYSAVCGGHTENNDIVWGGVPNASLRGRPDTLPGFKPKGAPSALTDFLTLDAPHACRLSSFAQLAKYRWEKRFTAKELDEKTAALKLGSIFSLSVVERGVSGRARLLNLSGENGATQIRGELNIRRLFGMLNSAMFEVRLEKDAKGRPATWIFTGGGWGHGVGMCQTGAIGRAEAGQSYREILAHYYNGATVAPIY